MKERPKTLTPKLRFPEFRDAPGWEIVPLGKLLSRTPAYGINAAAVPFAEELPVYLRITDIDEDGRYITDGKVSVAADVSEGNFLVDGDIVLARTGASVGKSYRYRQEDGRLVFAGFLIRVTPDPEKLSPALLAQYMTTRRYWHWVLTTSARSGQPGINGTEYASLPVPIPNSSGDYDGAAEQRKIAACLTSLDDLLAAERRKLDGLRDHKKGLIQQLFPRQGESRPRLRFPEFRTRLGWSPRKIRDLLEKASFPIQTDAEKEYREIGVRSHGKGVFHKHQVKGSTIGSKRVFRVVENAFVVNIVFAWEQAVAFTTEAEAGMIASHRFPMFLPKSNRCDVRFLTLAFLTPTGKDLLAIASPGGAGRNRTLGQEEFEKLEVAVPEKDEQTRIADALLAADALISAQSRKLEGLRAHKKGLMEQLFPSP